MSQRLEMEPNAVKSETATVVIPPADASALASLGNGRKYALLIIFTVAQFMDVASNSMLLPAVPRVAGALGLTGSESSWLFAAYQSTFAAFLLISGRASDVYTPKPVFIGGNMLLGGMALITGFVHNKIGLLVLRALSGIGAAFTIPAALNMLVKLFPDPQEQARAFGIFGIAGALGNFGGLLIGGVLAQFATWHWIFWLIAIVTLPIAFGCILFIPGMAPPKSEGRKLARLDLIGVTFLTAAILLFIFAVTQGSNEGWGKAGVITPLIISVVLVILFFIWERRMPEGDASLPPKLWFYPNFSILFGMALLIYNWWSTVLFMFTSLWQSIYHYSTINAAIRFLPVGVIAGLVAPFVSVLAGKIPAKRIALPSLFLMFVATLLLPFADQRARYWSLVFPAFVIGSGATMGLYIVTSVAFFQTTPPEVAGTVGAAFNSALQLGSALGIAISQSMQTSIDKKQPNKLHGYSGRAAAFWFLLALIAIETLATAVFYKSAKVGGKDDLEATPEGKLSAEEVEGKPEMGKE